MSNTIPAAADLYAVVDITKKNEKYLQEKNSDIPVYHVLDRENNADLRNVVEVDEKTSMNVMDMYSVVDVTKKGNKVQGQPPKGTSLNKWDDSRKLKIASNSLFHNVILPIAVISIIVFLCFILLLMIILFAITFQKLSELNKNIEASVTSSEVINSNFTTFVDYIKSNPYLYINSLPLSCSEISKINEAISSGYYTVKSSTGDLKGVYCDLNRTFGGNSTGWMRVAELDVTNCPQGFRNQFVGADKTCVVFEDSAGCTEIRYPVYNIQHTKITGRIRAYQINSSDGFVPINEGIRNPNNISSNYLDGVSITANGLHVWSFAAGCNCSIDKMPPSFVNEEYTCGGIEARHSYQQLIWESQQCQRNSTWFFRSLPPSTADIEVRVCRDQVRADEDLAITSLELYIQ